MNKLIYLASPYSHPEQSVRDDRYDAVTKLAAKLVEKGVYFIPPITFNVPLAPYLTNPDTSWEFWKPFDLMLIDRCDELWIFTYPGFYQSVGLRAEVLYAIEKNKTIRRVNSEGKTVLMGKGNILALFSCNTIDQLERSA
jgi:hypothetical protein